MQRAVSFPQMRRLHPSTIRPIAEGLLVAFCISGRLDLCRRDPKTWSDKSRSPWKLLLHFHFLARLFSDGGSEFRCVFLPLAFTSLLW